MHTYGKSNNPQVIFFTGNPGKSWIIYQLLQVAIVVNKAASTCMSRQNFEGFFVTAPFNKFIGFSVGQ